MPETLPLPESPRQGVERFELTAVPLAVARYDNVSMGDLRALFDTTFQAMGAAIGADKVHPAGPALAVYHGDPSQTFDVEIGFPVTESVREKIIVGDIAIQNSWLPAGPAAGATHLGSFDGLGESWGRLMQDVADSGEAPGSMVEIYVTEPSPDMNPDDLRTDLIVSLAPHE
ncbi:GyrI-like domain-containing protein [Pseudoclavibacter sp. RFBB5]|uniref:GyrI-like domain-containing protein n=1 Tax=Pseudoclavibacter sp. RFBB5 TaxID=2080574 RepID=UPI000CE8E1FB|nr:GyrI-like domain-containing protein [Pseudoclavibacter sp. RFBB5]PPG33320.1 AraC family transcriptional regulator [Pseudoclavibacter sp. RFBB5]